MSNIIKYLDSSHIIEKICSIDQSIILEIIIIIFLLNLVFAITYYKLYKNNNKVFKNIHNPKKKIGFFDFIYFTNTTFFSLGYDIIPQSILVKIICMLHIKLSFIIMTIYIAKIIKN